MYRSCLLNMVLVFVPSALLINVIGWTFLLLFMQVHSENSFRVPGAADFFEVPIFKIIWGHGINNRALLKKSLEGTLISAIHLSIVCLLFKITVLQLYVIFVQFF